MDGEGNKITSGITTAEADWMTENFVPFRAKLEFSPPATDKGTLILKKGNPSNLPEDEDELVIPVVFTVTAKNQK